MITITRKIQLLFDTDDKKQLKELYQRVYGWQRICHKAANLVATHQYVQDRVKDLLYFTEETKVKLENIKKDETGILTTSRPNTTYQILSKNFKGEAPMGMLSMLNTVISKTYKAESSDVWKGLKSLRSYKEGIPMPVRRADVSRIVKLDDGNYSFFVYGTSFRTFFGRDLSGNQIIFDRAMQGEYKWCDSSIKLDGKKMFLLAVFQFEKEDTVLDKEIICNAELDVNIPIKVSIGNKSYEIGSQEEFLYRRLAIQGALRRSQKAARFNKGGHGRTKKMQSIDHFKKLEDNYVDTRIHQYTSKLVDYCIKFKCGTLVLKKQTEKEADAKQEENIPYLLRNWTYFGMKDKLKYKCAKFGIELIVE
jgi:IS605 OrfB family transposase